MTRKDFELIASILSDARRVKASAAMTARHFSMRLAKEYPRFDQLGAAQAELNRVIADVVGKTGYTFFSIGLERARQIIFEGRIG